MGSRGPASAAALGAIVAVVVLLALPPLGTPTPASAGPPAPVAAPRGAMMPAGPLPRVTGAWDWDPQPFFPPGTIPIDQVAGEGAAMATSDRYGVVVLFGGEGFDGLTNVTATVSEATYDWQRVTTPSAPTPRANFSLATFDGGRFAVLFGGLVNLTSGACDNATWIYSFANRTWTNVTHGAAPGARESYALAVDDGAGVAVLEGGRNRDYVLNGSGASVLWNDTWTLNLTTFNWSVAHPAGAPVPRFGSSMVFAPPQGRFYLFGGCSAFCSSAVYAYAPGGNWTRVATTGDYVAPRGGTSAVWDPVDNVTMVAMGFEPGPTDYVGLNDTFLFTPSLAQWDLVASSNGPSARWGAAAAFLVANQCPGLFLLGGSTVLGTPPADGWFLDTNPDLAAGCNTWGGDQVGGGPGGGGSNCTPAANLSVRLVAQTSLKGLGNGSVTIAGACGRQALPTNAAGYANFTGLPFGPISALGNVPGYHGNSSALNLTNATGNRITIEMVSLPNLSILTFGVTLAGTAPLPYTDVTFDGVADLGLTDAAGWLNLTGFSGASGPGTFVATKASFSNATRSIAVPYTGNLSFSLTLLADGAFDVQVVEVPDLTPVVGAQGAITPVGANTFGGPVAFATGPDGWFNTTLPQANYTVRATFPGFLPNATRGAVFHSWLNTTVVVLNLTLGYGANVSVLLRDARTGTPIGGGNVTVGYFPGRNTSSSGWANFTDLLPPGRYRVLGAAVGYASNQTTVDLTYRSLLTRVELNLTPLVPCTPAEPCSGPSNRTPGAFTLLPAGGFALTLVYLAPILLAVVGAAYVLYLRAGARSRGAPG